MRFLILAHVGDETALRVCAMLRARHGAEGIKLVSAEELALAPYWAHRFEDTRVTTKVRLSDGSSLDSADIGVIFNRLLTLALPQFASANEGDRDYAIQEMNAFFLSWLASLPCPLINAPTSMSLNGPVRSYAEWLLLASKAGLPVRGYHFTSDPRRFQEKTYLPHKWLPAPEKNSTFAFEEVSALHASRQPIFYLEAVSEQRQSILAVGNTVVGSLASRYSEQVRLLAKMSGCDLLEIIFARLGKTEANEAAAENWKVCGVNAFPHVQTAEAVSAIVQLLEAKQADFHTVSVVQR